MTHRFNTPRLTVIEANTELEALDLDAIYTSIIKILTSEVVAQLPPYFAGIQSRSQAKAWFERMLDESHLFLVYHKISQHLIGFSFIYLEQTDEGKKNAHLGYLLTQASWGKGFASELVSHLIEHIKTRDLADTLIAGVDESNLASIALLKKLGFNQGESDVPENLFFQLKLNH